ncbi:MAG: hypothetical protein ACLP1D_03640 [Xanthobacteraceae bacterium]
MEKLLLFSLLIVATVLEATGDAVVRMGLMQAAWPSRLGLFLAGAALLFSYGLALNLAPVEFGRVAGLYLAMLFVVWQIVNWFTFHTAPSTPIVIGGALIVAGGLVVTFWE